MTPTGEPDRRAVADLLAFCDQAARLVQRGRSAYQADEMLRLASEAITSRVGEAAGRLSPTFRDRHPEIPWRAIKGMRNVVTHEYGRIDHVLLWNTLTTDLPRLAQRLQPGTGPVSADSPRR